VSFSPRTLGSTGCNCLEGTPGGPPHPCSGPPGVRVVNSELALRRLTRAEILRCAQNDNHVTLSKAKGPPKVVTALAAAPLSRRGFEITLILGIQDLLYCRIVGLASGLSCHFIP